MDDTRNPGGATVGMQARVQLLLDRGLRRYIQGDVKAAVTDWHKVLELDPNCAEAQQYLDDVSQIRHVLERRPSSPTEAHLLAVDDSFPLEAIGMESDPYHMIEVLVPEEEAAEQASVRRGDEPGQPTLNEDWPISEESVAALPPPPRSAAEEALDSDLQAVTEGLLNIDHSELIVSISPPDPLRKRVRELGEAATMELVPGSGRNADVDTVIPPADVVSSDVDVEEITNVVAGAEISAETDVEPGTKVGAELDVEPGTDVGAEIGVEPSTKVGVAVGVEPGTKVGADMGADMGADIGADIGAEPGADIDADSADYGGPTVLDGAHVTAGRGRWHFGNPPLRDLDQTDPQLVLPPTGSEPDIMLPEPPTAEPSPLEPLPSEPLPSEPPPSELSPSELSPSELPPSELPPSELPPSELPPSELPPSELPTIDRSAPVLPLPEITIADEPAPITPSSLLAIPDGMVSENTVPERSVPDKTVPGHPAPNSTIPGRPTPIAPVPSAPVPNVTIPGHPMPDVSLSEKTYPGRSLSEPTKPGVHMSDGIAVESSSRSAGEAEGAPEANPGRIDRAATDEQPAGKKPFHPAAPASDADEQEATVELVFTRWPTETPPPEPVAPSADGAVPRHTRKFASGALSASKPPQSQAANVRRANAPRGDADGIVQNGLSKNQRDPLVQRDTVRIAPDVDDNSANATASRDQIAAAAAASGPSVAADGAAVGEQTTDDDVIVQALVAELNQRIPAQRNDTRVLRQRINWLIERAQSESARGCNNEAITAVELALSEEPDSAITVKLIHTHLRTVLRIYERYLGSPAATPKLAAPLTGAEPHALDNRAVFLLSRIDGTLSIDDLLSVSGMPRLETYRHLCNLLRYGIVTLNKDSNT